MGVDDLTAFAVGGDVFKNAFFRDAGDAGIDDSLAFLVEEGEEGGLFFLGHVQYPYRVYRWHMGGC